MSTTAVGRQAVQMATREASVPKREAQQAASVNTASGVGSLSATPEAVRFIQHLSQNNHISQAQKEALIDVAALVDNVINNPTARNSVYKELSGAGVYLGNTSNEGYPRYLELTGLRYYGGKRVALAATGKPVPEMEVSIKSTAQPPKAAPPPPTPQQVQQMRQAVEAIVQSERGVSMEQVQEAVQQSPIMQKEVAAAVGHDQVVGGVAAAENPPKKIVQA